MRVFIHLTQGAWRLLSARYKSILAKCCLAAICGCFFMSAAASAADMDGADNLPPPGSSFSIKGNMLFKDKNLSYNKISDPYEHFDDFSLTLENSGIRANEIDITHTLLKSIDSSLESAGRFGASQTEISGSSFSSGGHMTFNAPLAILAGGNTLTSDTDISFTEGTLLGADSSLNLNAKRTIAGLGQNGLNANNVSADYVEAGNPWQPSSLVLRNGAFTTANKSSPNMIFGSMLLENMDTNIGSINVFDAAKVDGGHFKANEAGFHKSVDFTNADIDISSLTAAEFSAKGGSLKLGGNESSNEISGNFSLSDVTGNVGNLQVKGRTSIEGGTFTANSLELGETVFSNLQPQIGQLKLGGSLSLLNNATLQTTGESIGANDVNIGKSRLDIEGHFSPKSLAMDGGTLNVTGRINMDQASASLASSEIFGESINMATISASGQNLLEAKTITAGNIDILSGATVLHSTVGTGSIKADAIQLHSGAHASLRSVNPVAGSISGSGSLDAHNLKVKNNLSLSDGSLYLTGDAVIQRNLALDKVNASVENLKVEGQAGLSATTLTGKNITLMNGATLEHASTIEAQTIDTGSDIRLIDNAEILAADISLGDGHLVLEGAQNQRAVVAVGEFSSGDLTVEANSFLSIGSNMPDWVNAGMNSHNANAALGLWRPFALGAGANAAIGAGSGMRYARDAGIPQNQIAFMANSLLITNATVASKEGAGAISARDPSVANVEAGAKLHILHAEKDGLYRVLGENITVNYDGDAWQGDNVKTDTHLIKLERLEGDKLGWFQAKAPGASTVLPGLDPDVGGSVDDAGNNGQIPPETPAPPVTETPEQPKPDAPQPPAQPEPGQPGAPQPPSPDKPDNPNPPAQPEPGQPGAPQPPAPDKPDNPNPPAEPEPGAPDQPGPDNPDSPEPEQPAPDVPQQPETTPSKWHYYTPGQLFLSRATNFWFMGHDANLAARTIESSARIFALGAVPDMTMAANQAASAAMGQRLWSGHNSGIQAMDENGAIIENGEKRQGFALWISPLYKSVNGYSLTAGNFSVDKNGALGGLAIGADHTFENALRVGISLNIGGGYSQSGGDLAKTTNNMSFWGLGAYAGWSSGNFDISADVAFTSTYNKLEQELPWQMNMEDLKSDISAGAISAGLELAYAIPTRFINIRPHVGARYTFLYNDSYDVNSYGTVLEGKAKTQNIWTFPLGISLEKNFEFDNGWHLRPLLDFSVIPAAGDLKARSEVRYTGTRPWASLKDQFMDDISYRGTAGLEFGAGNFSLGLNYSVQAGMKTNSQSVMGTFAYTF